MKILKEASKKVSYNKESEMSNKKDSNPVQWLEEHYPTMTNEFKRIQGEQYKLFCRKQYDYGPMNIAMGTDLSEREDINLVTLSFILTTKAVMASLMSSILDKSGPIAIFIGP